MATFTDNNIKEELSIAYLTAITSVAGIAINRNENDVESEDIGLTFQTKDKDGNDFIVNLNVQLKATSAKSEYKIKVDKISYKLKTKNFNDLIARRSTPIILGILIIPDYHNCLNWTIQQLIMKGTMYWISLEGRQKTKLKSKIKVDIPSKQVLNSITIIDIMNKIAKGEKL